MAFHNSLVLVSDDNATAAVEAAFMLADGVRGHVSGVHIKGDKVLNMPSVHEGMSESQIYREFEAAKAKVAQREADAEQLFRAAAERQGAGMVSEPGDGLSADWRVVEGLPERVLPEISRVHDAVISTAVGETAGEGVLSAVEETLFGSGRPVVVVPQEMPKSIGRHVVIGWNRSAQAARAVMAAMPTIKAADKVTICHVETGAKPGPSADDLARGLAWHGVDVTVRKVVAGGAISDLLVNEAADIGGDLLVMGAYSHSRMREFVLGGVTHHALRHVVMPMLLTH